jgi:hypothetical protein
MCCMELEGGAPGTFKFLEAHGIILQVLQLWIIFIYVNLVKKLMSTMAKFIYIGFHLI